MVAVASSPAGSLVQPFKTEAEWLEARTFGIGGSDSASLFSVNPYKSFFELWAEKSHLIERSFEESEAMYWGKALEDIIAARYQEVTGRQLVDHGRYTMFRSSVFDYLFCTPDREIVGDPRGPGWLSIKNVTQFKAGDWEEEAPAYYQIQLQTELAVTGAQWGSFGVLIGGNTFKWLDVERNEAFIELLFDRARDLKRRVEEGDAPPTDGSKRTTEALARLYSGVSGETVRLGEDLEGVALELEATKDLIKSQTSRKDELLNMLKAAIGSAAFGQFADGSGYKRSVIEKKSYQVKATSYVELRRKNAK